MGGRESVIPIGLGKEDKETQGKGSIFWNNAFGGGKGKGNGTYWGGKSKRIGGKEEKEKGSLLRRSVAMSVARRDA